MHRNEVAFRKNRAEIGSRYTSHGLDFFSRHEGVIADDPHADGFAELRHIAADGAEPQDCDGLVQQLEGDTLAPDCIVALHLLIMPLHQVLGQSEEHGDGMLSDRMVVGTGGPDHGNAALCGSFHVHHVKSHAGTPDDLQIRRSVDGLGGNPGNPCDDCISVRDRVFVFGDFLRVQDLCLAAFQQLHGFIDNRMRKNEFHIRVLLSQRLFLDRRTAGQTPFRGPRTPGQSAVPG